MVSDHSKKGSMKNLQGLHRYPYSNHDYEERNKEVIMRILFFSPPLACKKYIATSQDILLLEAIRQ